MDHVQAAKRIWPILTQAAREGETVSYSVLAERIDVHRRALRFPLGVIQAYCLENRLPPLTAIVVRKRGGKPGPGFTAAPKGAEAEAWKQVRSFAWPPQNPFAAMPVHVDYWVLACNPKKWAMDKFLAAGIRSDEWGIRKSDRTKFAPGQLALVRVGVDQRNRKERRDRPKMQAGIYAVCQIESHAYPATGKSDKYGDVHGRGWPTVKITYLHTFEGNPLTIEQMRKVKPALSRHLLNGLQASSFPISEADFRLVVGLLGLDFDELGTDIISNDAMPTAIEGLEEMYGAAAPSVKERISRYIERGPVGAEVKRANGYKCQICEKLGTPSLGFFKTDGTPYVEAHHVVPVANLAVGSLGPANIISVCANHHRELHYGCTRVNDRGASFEIVVSGGTVIILKYAK